MKHYLFSRRIVGLGIVIAGLALVPVSVASAATAVTSCPVPALSQPFLAVGDSNEYTLAPGESADDFNGTGWTLTGGATIVTTTLQDGTTGSVLNLTAGSRAVSPPMCVSGGYPIARMVTRTLGSATSNATMFYASPAGDATLGRGMPILAATSWGVTAPVDVAPGTTAAEQVQYTLVAGANVAAMRVYDVYIDPRMHY